MVFGHGTLHVAYTAHEEAETETVDSSDSDSEWEHNDAEDGNTDDHDSLSGTEAEDLSWDESCTCMQALKICDLLSSNFNERKVEKR